MTDELTKVIRERITAGQSREDIIQAVLAMGHAQDVTEVAYTLASHDVSTGTDTPLHFSARALFKGGWEFVKMHPRLTAVSAIPLVVEVALTTARTNGLVANSTLANSLIALYVLAGFLYIFSLMVVLMRLTQSNVPLSVRSALAFAQKNFFPLCLIYLFSGLLILGGLTFLLLPGLAVMVSIGFAQYVYLYEGKGGLNALLQSTALVRGRFWHVLHKIAAFIFISFLPMLALVVVFGIVSAFYENTITNLISESMLQIVTAVLTIINLHAMNHIYLKLKEHNLNLPGKLFPKARYILLMLVGAGMIAFIALAYAFAESIDSMFKDIPALENSNGVQSQVSATSLVAKDYFLNNGQSYAGVCESLKNSLTESKEVTCNDNKEAWALTATAAEGILWCADKTTLAKQIQNPLETRTECFVL
jgi:hypothetical protein